MFETLSTWLYQMSVFADRLANEQLAHLSWTSAGVIFATGLLTSLTPCMLSMLPITIGYIGGYESEGRGQAARQSMWFALGLATTLAGLGIVAATLGRIYGQVGAGLPIFVSLVAIVMGLNLLELVPLQFPSWGGDEWIDRNWPKGARSYLLGLTFGLAASPCSTPVLATLLAWVGAQQDLWLGGGLLLAYAAGYVAPLVAAGIFAASVKRFLEFRRWSSWINSASGALLVGFGVFSLLSRLPQWG
ncbi:cytochrome c biogenesis protein CcdA [Oscillatoria sp. FACHB-1406]|uniref:cytochrome c biogenesis protein CcdA n=1 Tax=Oscillatoria sp. FACHB-1406 TaxID=2692846 RepID=UPI001685255A|nr:cytochrome c biogenesis protein CcdA [Oscillatoria sp. FACHB-1406]MBD2579302.1 cytochrome c biogenesis protein CcdA [Oscillatoria sp. FACHB-1406]